MGKIISSPAGDLDTVGFDIQNGRVVPAFLMNRRGTPSGVAFVDQISFTFLDDFHRNPHLRNRVAECRGGTSWLSDDEVIEGAVSSIIRNVFGLVIANRRAAGLNFYRDTWTLADGSGMVSIGGQGGTILVQITGQGMAAARCGWEHRLYKWARLMTRFVITRLDLAYDDLDGTSYSVDQAASDYDNGLFSMGGRPPTCEQRGNWRRVDGRGRSFYVGKREYGKMLRVYEKGMQLGDSESRWVRAELELHNKDRVIPFDAVFRPGDYLAGSYSALIWVSSGDRRSRIATVRKIALMTYEKALSHLSRSYGGLLRVILFSEPSPLDCLESLSSDRPVPRRLDAALAPLVPAV